MLSTAPLPVNGPSVNLPGLTTVYGMPDAFTHSSPAFLYVSTCNHSSNDNGYGPTPCLMCVRGHRPRGTIQCLCTTPCLCGHSYSRLPSWKRFNKLACAAPKHGAVRIQGWYTVPGMQQLGSERRLANSWSQHESQKTDSFFSSLPARCSP